MDTFDFTEFLDVPSYALDGKLLATPTFLFNILQNIADNHVNKHDIGWNFMHERNMFWAISKMDMEISRRPCWREKVKLTTWGKGRNHLIQPRDYLIETMDGEVLVRATSNWVILDENGKPRLLEELVPDIRFMCENNALNRPAKRLRVPAQGVPSEFKSVEYSYIDMNRHANNSAYVTWLMNDFSVDYHSSHELIALSVNYLQQTHFTDRYTVVKQELAPNDYLVSMFTEKDNREVCRLQATFREV